MTFSIANLLIITAALAVGLAIGLSPPPDLNSLEVDLRWLQGLMSSGAALLVCELVRHVFFLARRYASAAPHIRVALGIALFQRLLVAILLAGLLTFRLVINQQGIVDLERENYTGVYPYLMPDLMLMATIFAGIRMLLVRRAPTTRSAANGVIAGVIVTVGVIGIALFMLIDRQMITALVHIAISAVEHGQPLAMRRSGFFPNHEAEGFQTFWWSATAAVGVLLAAGLLGLHARVKSSFTRTLASGVILILLFGTGLYVRWFVQNEFPRINPDLASAGFQIAWFDMAGWWLLLVGLATTLGLMMALRRSNVSAPVVKLPRLSILGILAAYLLAVAAALHANSSMSQYAFYSSSDRLGGFLSWFCSTSFWSNWQESIRVLGQTALQPEVLLLLMLTASSLTLAWQTIRKPKARPCLQPVAGTHVLGYSLAAFALLIVAIPTLGIFGFCIWLSPYVW